MNLHNIATIKEIAIRYGFSFSKSLGQNFLINPSVCPKIADLGNAKDNGVIEIGTGFGVLTRELCEVAKKVVAIELDEHLMPVLKETLADFDNVSVINSDVLQVDLKALIEDNFDGLDVVVCANLPYYITSPILMYLLESRLPIKSITVMVQREAAQRICAVMGSRECSAITFAVRYYATPTLLFNVSRGSFMPSPNVDSSVIRLDLHEQSPFEVCSEKFLFMVVRACFSQRRKILVNPLSFVLSIKKEVVQEALIALNIKANARAEELTIEQFVKLSNYLYKR